MVSKKVQEEGKKGVEGIRLSSKGKEERAWLQKQVVPKAIGEWLFGAF